MRVRLKSAAWDIGSEIDSGGFGRILGARSAEVADAVAKFVPLAPGPDRELLIGDALAAAQLDHVVPILDSGESDGAYVLIMPRAEYSLRALIGGRGLPSLEEIVVVLSDVASALLQIEGQGIIHRDLKPENVLWLDGSWRICDFGIARYRDETTAAFTRKFFKSEPYAAPEQWRDERATAATDVYAFGVMAYELVSGKRPFLGPDFRNEHLHSTPAPLTATPSRLRLLIEECLEKAVEARPTAAQLVQRLSRVAEAPAGSGAQRLAVATQKIAQQRAIDGAQQQRQITERERRQRLYEAATRLFSIIPASLLEALQTEAPAVEFGDSVTGGRLEFDAKLGSGLLAVSKPTQCHEWTGPFEVIAAANIEVTQGSDPRGYIGRSHSLWYCDAKEEGVFAWYELAFMPFALQGVMPALVPFSRDPRDVEDAFSMVIGVEQLAWPIEQIERDDLTDFIDRWLGWFADAVERGLRYPSMLPEKPVSGGYRRIP